MTREDALKRLAVCRDNQPDAWQLIVSRDIVDALLEPEPGTTTTAGEDGGRGTWDAAQTLPVV